MVVLLWGIKGKEGKLQESKDRLPDKKEEDISCCGVMFDCVGQRTKTGKDHGELKKWASCHETDMKLSFGH